MGVPGFFMWLIKKYRKNGFVFQKEKLTLISIEELRKKVKDEEKIALEIINNEYKQNLLNKINDIDYFLIDANCLIHPVCYDVIAKNSDITNDALLENKMINEVINYLNMIITYVNPKKGVYLAIDGVAPVAKIKQQRSRRFKSIADKAMWDNVKKKFNKPLSRHWNSNAITPGTNFMVKLHDRIMSWAKDANRNIIYSSCFTPAEGEHKLLQFIRNNKEDYSYSIYGLDADLLFLALSTNKNNIFLLREANQMNNKDDKDVFNFVSIDIMVECIINTIKEFINKSFIKTIGDIEIKKSYVDELNKIKLINDFIFMCYFLGNDFLPHIPSLNIHHDGIEYLITNYADTMNSLYFEKNEINYLLDNNKKVKINNDFLKLFITRLGNQEEETLKDEFGKKRRIKCDGDDYEKEVFRIDNIQFKVRDPIKLGSDNLKEWRNRYYKHYWDVDEDEIEEFSKKLVEHYLMGVKWVSSYYFYDCPSWDWYYPFDYPPFISDIAKYIDEIDMNGIKFKKGKPLKPYMQLMAVFPPQSNELLPINFRKLMLNTNSSLAYLYPTSFDQDFIGKNKYWMGIPQLPPLDIELVKYTFHKYKDELSKDDINKNKELEIFNFEIS